MKPEKEKPSIVQLVCLVIQIISLIWITIILVKLHMVLSEPFVFYRDLR